MTFMVIILVIMFLTTIWMAEDVRYGWLKNKTCMVKNMVLHSVWASSNLGAYEKWV